LRKGFTRLSVSTWSLHRALGRPAFYEPEADGKFGSAPTTAAAFSLLELPGCISTFGIRTLEICHFHLPNCDRGYLAELRNAIETAGVELWSLLIDAGDITQPNPVLRKRDLSWIGAWLDVAAQLGAKNARVIAGKAQPNEDTLKISLAGMQQLNLRAKSHGLRLMTENWFDLLSRPQRVLWLLDEMQGDLGLCLDFGNWRGATKYEDLAAIFPHADSCHAKCRFPAPGEMDRDDYARCLELGRAAHFAGPYTLIYDGPGDDEWDGLRVEREVVEPYLRHES
jgi:sugar phosphate isomerase/epimerase